MTLKNPDDIEQPPAGPIWWTTLTTEDFCSGKLTNDQMISRCHKSKTWFTARTRLSGHPKKLYDVAPSHLAFELEQLLEAGNTGVTE